MNDNHYRDITLRASLIVLNMILNRLFSGNIFGGVESTRGWFGTLLLRLVGILLVANTGFLPTHDPVKAVPFIW